MKTVKFKTTINCDGCIRSVTPFLNELDNVDMWKVDIDDEDKETVTEAVKKAGFEIEEI
jgi:copper chaperone